jgi:hypothetical protein
VVADIPVVVVVRVCIRKGFDIQLGDQDEHAVTLFRFKPEVEKSEAARSRPCVAITIGDRCPRTKTSSRRHMVANPCVHQISESSGLIAAAM